MQNLSSDKITRIEDFIFNTDACIMQEEYGPCYIGATDKICMPDNISMQSEKYYSLLFHEIIHWTGHPSRLNRNRGNIPGTKLHSHEELIAEIGAAFLCDKFEITNVHGNKQKGSYFNELLKPLAKEKNPLGTAIITAKKAYDFLFTLKSA